MSFDDLPMIRDEGEMRRVHNETAMYFLSKGLVAHAEMTCHLAVGDDNWSKLVRTRAGARRTAPSSDGSTRRGA